MELKEKFDAMVANGGFKNDILRNALSGFVGMEETIRTKNKSMYKGLIFLIIWLGKVFPKDAAEIAKLISKKHKVVPKTKLVVKDVSPESDDNIFEDGGCAGCDADDEPEKNEDIEPEKIVEKVIEKEVESGNLSDAKTPTEVMNYFDNDIAKMDAYLNTMGIETKATTALGKAKKILAELGTEE